MLKLLADPRRSVWQAQETDARKTRQPGTFGEKTFWQSDENRTENRRVLERNKGGTGESLRNIFLLFSSLLSPPFQSFPSCPWGTETLSSREEEGDEQPNSANWTPDILRCCPSSLILLLWSENQKSLGRFQLGPKIRELCQGIYLRVGKKHRSQAVTTINFSITLSHLKFSWA